MVKNFTNAVSDFFSSTYGPTSAFLIVFAIAVLIPTILSK